MHIIFKKHKEKGMFKEKLNNSTYTFLVEHVNTYTLINLMEETLKINIWFSSRIRHGRVVIVMPYALPL